MSAQITQRTTATTMRSMAVLALPVNTSVSPNPNPNPSARTKTGKTHRLLLISSTIWNSNSESFAFPVSAEHETRLDQSLDSLVRFQSAAMAFHTLSASSRAGNLPPFEAEMQSIQFPFHDILS